MQFRAVGRDFSDPDTISRLTVSRVFARLREHLRIAMRKTLGQRIRELRQERDLSLRDFGDKLGTTASPTSPAFLSDLENGRRFPSEEMLAKLAQVLGTTEDDLRSYDQRPPSRDIQDLVERNSQFGFAFRRAVEAIRSQNLTPDEFANRVEGTPDEKPHQQD